MNRYKYNTHVEYEKIYWRSRNIGKMNLSVFRTDIIMHLRIKRVILKIQFLIIYGVDSKYDVKVMANGNSLYKNVQK